jgi:hippurate hydrolase
VRFSAGFPAVRNASVSAEVAARVARDLVGSGNVDAAAEPVLGSEDFAYMLERRPGCFLFIGNRDEPDSCTIHDPGYGFNDDILILGATFWARLAQTYRRGEAA